MNISIIKMHIRKLIIILAGSLITLGSFASNKNAGDPFLKAWVNKDGVFTHYLSIKKSGTYYRVSYEFSHMSYLSEMCTASSNNIYCPYLTLTRDDSNHSITISDPKFVYYDPAYMPPLAEYMGSWKAKDFRNTELTINIMRGFSDSEVRISTSGSDGCGSTDGDIYDDIYQVAKNPDGTLLFTAKDWMSEYRIIYDPKTKQIKPDFNGSSRADMGMCVILYDNEPQLSFKKN